MLSLRILVLLSLCNIFCAQNENVEENEGVAVQVPYDEEPPPPPNPDESEDEDEDEDEDDRDPVGFGTEIKKRSVAGFGNNENPEGDGAEIKKRSVEGFGNGDHREGYGAEIKKRSVEGFGNDDDREGYGAEIKKRSVEGFGNEEDPEGYGAEIKKRSVERFGNDDDREGYGAEIKKRSVESFGNDENPEGDGAEIKKRSVDGYSIDDSPEGDGAEIKKRSVESFGNDENPEGDDAEIKKRSVEGYSIDDSPEGDGAEIKKRSAGFGTDEDREGDGAEIKKRSVGFGPNDGFTEGRAMIARFENPWMGGGLPVLPMIMDRLFRKAMVLAKRGHSGESPRVKGEIIVETGRAPLPAVDITLHRSKPRHEESHPSQESHTSPDLSRNHQNGEILGDISSLIGDLLPKRLKEKSDDGSGTNNNIDHVTGKMKIEGNLFSDFFKYPGHMTSHRNDDSRKPLANHENDNNFGKHMHSTLKSLEKMKDFSDSKNNNLDKMNRGLHIANRLPSFLAPGLRKNDQNHDKHIDHKHVDGSVWQEKIEKQHPSPQAGGTPERLTWTAEKSEHKKTTEKTKHPASGKSLKMEHTESGDAKQSEHHPRGGGGSLPMPKLPSSGGGEHPHHGISSHEERVLKKPSTRSTKSPPDTTTQSTAAPGATTAVHNLSEKKGRTTSKPTHDEGNAHTGTKMDNGKENTTDKDHAITSKSQNDTEEEKVKNDSSNDHSPTKHGEVDAKSGSINDKDNMVTRESAKNHTGKPSKRDVKPEGEKSEEAHAQSRRRDRRSSHEKSSNGTQSSKKKHHKSGASKSKHKGKSSDDDSKVNIKAVGYVVIGETSRNKKKEGTTKHHKTSTKSSKKHHSRTPHGKAGHVHRPGDEDIKTKGKDAEKEKEKKEKERKEEEKKKEDHEQKNKEKEKEKEKDEKKKDGKEKNDKKEKHEGKNSKGKSRILKDVLKKKAKDVNVTHVFVAMAVILLIVGICVFIISKSRGGSDGLERVNSRTVLYQPNPRY